MENFKLNELEFEDLEINNIFKKINDSFRKDNENFAELCFWVHRLKQFFKEKGYFKTKDKKIFWFNDAMNGFGLSQTLSKNIINCYEKFIEKSDVGPKVKDVFFPFSKSKLFELLCVSNLTLENDISNGLLSPDMSVKEIREYVKNLKYVADKSEVVEICGPEINEEDIPLAFDPNEEYKLEYFVSLSKNQLVNICLTMQDFYHKKKRKN